MIHEKNSYLPDEQRVEAAYQDFRSGHLEIDPFVTKKHFLDKARIVEKEMGPPSGFSFISDF